MQAKLYRFRTPYLMSSSMNRKYHNLDKTIWCEPVLYLICSAFTSQVFFWSAACIHQWLSSIFRALPIAFEAQPHDPRLELGVILLARNASVCAG
jgi:hypothetical protein